MRTDVRCLQVDAALCYYATLRVLQGCKRGNSQRIRGAPAAGPGRGDDRPVATLKGMESRAQQTMSQISSSALLGETRPASARPMRPARLGSMQGLLLFVPSGAAGIHRCILSKSEDGRSRRDATRKTALVDSRNPKRPRNPLPDHLASLRPVRRVRADLDKARNAGAFLLLTWLKPRYQ